MYCINYRSLRYLVVMFLFAPAGVYADSWVCSHNDLIRKVQIEYTGDGKVPCNVIYSKPTEGVESQVLWFADNEEGYCEEQAQGFVAKLESWGWDCASADEVESEAETETETAKSPGAEP